MLPDGFPVDSQAEADLTCCRQAGWTYGVILNTNSVLTLHFGNTGTQDSCSDSENHIAPAVKSKGPVADPEHLQFVQERMFGRCSGKHGKPGVIDRLGRSTGCATEKGRVLESGPDESRFRPHTEHI